jgi:hypothetical protein
MCDGVLTEVAWFRRVRIREPSDAAKRDANRQIAALHKRGAGMAPIGLVRANSP